jgi:hypothetical protein
LTFQLNQNSQDNWLDHVLLASASALSPSVFEHFPVDTTKQFIERCASQLFDIDYQSSVFYEEFAVLFIVL